ncbi:DUF4835 family protein [Aquimarina sp. AD10]|uniref:DUF4835 domain-containing protein n=1 Tax=Aquimarina aggregata TaxID=1642818 RepID=A0A163BUW2_9FLAO|nr:MULTISPECIES: DUF4835 family protein [Aquimarina]AXT63503.1 DUF4835 family protein [Aquimarina sp. AD10]KZS41807.1 hypothetical protein AWE51_20650 [Aquimarina aggregata]RKM99779.1 DUF4835 family protein [Aquimarina sp. AD10]
MNKLFFVIALVFSITVNAQEFNAQVVVNAEQTASPDLQVFKTLERSLIEFINNTKWTKTDYRTEERINCSFFITIVSFDNDAFTATVQVQASRPIYGSNYETAILNVNDKDFNFDYVEFQPLNYNPNSFDSNLISVISFYLYTILGVDADTFSLNGGTNYYEEAKSIVGNAQGGGSTKGWLREQDPNRYRLNDDLLSGAYDGYRSAMYTYHREGLDVMYNNIKKGKQTITESIKPLQEMNNSKPNSYLMRVFFDAKADEISSVLSGGPSVNIAETIQMLNRIAPTYTDNWKDIKF